MKTLLPIGIFLLFSQFIIAQNCTGIVPTYQESFDTFLAPCWQEATGGTLNGMPPSFGSSNWTQEEFAHNFISGGGAVNILMTGSNSRDWLVTPEFDLSAGGYELNFRSAATAVDNQGKAAIGSDDSIVIVNTTDGGTTWSILKTIDTNSDVSNVENFITVDLSTITSSTVTFAILADTGAVDDNAPYEFHLDDFVIESREDCSIPNFIVINDVGPERVEVVFETTNENATGNYEFALTNPFDGDPTIATPLRRGFFSGTTAAGTVVKIIGDGSGPDAPLPPNTEYDLYLREECTTGIFSDWSPAVPIRTICNTVNTTFPTQADFINHLPDVCWREATKGVPTNNPFDFGESDWRGGRAYTGRDGFAEPSNTIRLYRAEVNDWLISGIYDLDSTTNDVLSIEVAVTPFLATGVTPSNAPTAVLGSDDEVQLLYRNVNAGSRGPWQQLFVWNASNSPQASGQRQFLDISALSGTVEFAFYATDGDIDDAGVDIDFHIGLFFIDATASVVDIAQQQISLYPNPVNTDEVLNIELNQAFNSQTSVEIIGTNGKILQQLIMEPGERSKRLNNLNALSSGVYFIFIRNLDFNQTLRFVKN